jgi:hypothetical protein
MFISGCDRPASATAKQTPGSIPTLAWDLSVDQAPARIGWPNQVPEFRWFIDGPAILRLSLPADRQVTYTFQRAQIRRNGDAIYNVSLLFPAETFDDAYARVNRLADEWGVSNRERMKEFAAWRGRPPAGTYREHAETLRADVNPVGIELRHSYDPKRPWYVTFVYGFEQHAPRFSRGDANSSSGGRSAGE